VSSVWYVAPRSYSRSGNTATSGTVIERCVGSSPTLPSQPIWEVAKLVDATVIICCF